MSLTKQVNSALDKFYSNPYIGGFLAIFFILYAGLAAPSLPPFLARLFGNPIFKILFMILILIVRQYNPVLALLVSIGFALSLQTFHRYETRAALRDLSTNAQQSNTNLDAVPALFDSESEPVGVSDFNDNYSNVPESVAPVHSSPLPLPLSLSPIDETEVVTPDGFAGVSDGAPFESL